MCGYKGRESELMLTVAIQKEYTIVYFIKFKFLHMQFCNRIYQFFLKGKNSIMVLVTDKAMFDWAFLISFAREKSRRKKKQRQVKMWYNGKAFYTKAGVMF